MTETDTMAELSSVLERLNGRIDAMEKGEMPPGLKEHMADKKDDKKDDDMKEEKMYKEEDEKDDKDEDDTKKSEGYSDVITSEYLNWMENTLKSQGVDIGGARAHFDNVAKANLGSTPEQWPTEQHSGQVKGRATENGTPSTGAIGKVTGGGGTVEKGYLAPSDVSSADIEAAYEVYKAAAIEEQFKGSLENVFADRLSKELNAEAEARAAAQFDARAPLTNIEKALADLSERIDNIAKAAPAAGGEIRKANSTVEIPSTEELGNMNWDEVHALAGSVWN